MIYISKNRYGQIVQKDSDDVIICAMNATEKILSIYKDHGKEFVMISTDGRVENVAMLIDYTNVEEVMDENGNQIVVAPGTAQELLEALMVINQPVNEGSFPSARQVTIVELQTAVLGTDWVAFGDYACDSLHIMNNTGTTIMYRRNGNDPGFPILDKTTHLIIGITNSNEVSIRRLDISNTQVTVQVERYRY